MSDVRSVSLQSSVGTTTAEELANKYQKLFDEYSKIKAQQTVLKKAVIKEQAANVSLHEEVKTKEHELRTSLQQLDLLTFHNQRLTKRIESLQESGNTRLAPGWLLGSAKKELERSKSTLEALSTDLGRKIAENERLHADLNEVNGLYAHHKQLLQEKLSDLEKRNEELQVELKRSHLAGEEAVTMAHKEKQHVESELEKTRAELKTTKSFLEENECKMKDEEDSLRAEVSALQDTLSITLGLSEDSDKFNTLYNKVDSEADEIIASFRQLQSSAREYLMALKENSRSHSLGLQMKNASQAWHQNLQILAVKLASSQSRISELALEKEKLAKENENNARKIAMLETEIVRLKEELAKQHSNDTTKKETESAKIETNGTSATEENHLLEENFTLLEKENIIENEISKETQRDVKNTLPVNDANDANGINHEETLTKDEKDISQEETQDQIASNHDSDINTDGNEDDVDLAAEIAAAHLLSAAELGTVDDNAPENNAVTNAEGDEEDDDDDESVFVYEPTDETQISQDHQTSLLETTREIKTLQSMQPLNIRLFNSERDQDQSIVMLEHDTERMAISGDATRELLIKKHYETKIQQLTEQLQLADSKSVRFHKALKVMQAKLSEAEIEKENFRKDILKLQDEKTQAKIEFDETKQNHQKQVDLMTDFINQLQEQHENPTGSLSRPGITN
ncbi:8383_t:CDS:10 [Ambispora gerdemannii]|uniref:8383_t:CDS:1 n=1 Tax=Ambispora gerdemannii TaxID=144530 RepID=A0A9N8V712_9GLOM|nr:8383_t:CDS:10 [Ambispora gerdemannii]